MVAMLDRSERFPAIAAALGHSQHSVRVKASKLRLRRQREAVLSAAMCLPSVAFRAQPTSAARVSTNCWRDLSP